MAILEILTFPNPVLKKKAAPVAVFDAKLAGLAADMLETMYDAPGVGLAANQVGALERIVVIDVEYRVEGEDEKSRRVVGQAPRVFVNPEISRKSGKILFKEGCLSVPGVTEEVQRFERVTLLYRDLSGARHELEADGLLAVAIQHEIDHLDGRLFIDRLSLAKKGLIKGRLRKERDPEFERSRFHVEL